MDWIKRLNQVGGRLALAGSVEVLNWAYNPHLPDNVPHRHTYFEVCQVGAHGRGEFRVQDTMHPIASGDLFFARPGFVHQIVNTARQKPDASDAAIYRCRARDLHRTRAWIARTVCCCIRVLD